VGINDTSTVCHDTNLERFRSHYGSNPITLEEKRAEDERASRAMQHEMMMMLISYLSNNK
jgi:hypothetical protein